MLRALLAHITLKRFGCSLLGLMVIGGILSLSYDGVPLSQTALGSSTSIGVQVSATGEAICGKQISHRVTAEWEVSGADSPSVTISLVLPDGTTHSESRNVATGNVVFDLTLAGGGTLQVTVQASSEGASASASTTVTLSPCTREGFAGEPQWSGRKTEDPEFHAPPVGTSGKPICMEIYTHEATNIVGAQYENEQIDFQVQGTPGQQQQYGINQDCDQDGIGETWTWILADQQQAYLTGPDLKVISEVPLQRQAQGFSVPAQGPDCAVIVASFYGQMSQQSEQQEGKSGAQKTVQVGELIEQIALNTTAQAILIEGTQQQQQSSQGQQQQQQSLKDKFCPPRNRDTLDDVNGDGIQDIFYPENVQEFENIKIEVWCVSGNTFGKRITHPDGTQGWVGKCPYVGGQNRQVLIDLDGDGLPDVIRRTIVDGGADDDGDGRQDAMIYEYNINTRQHTATLTENGVVVRSQSHLGPYSSIGALPFFTN